MVLFTWTKIKDHHPNTTHAFRFFDVKGKGKIRKSEFTAGLEKLRINLSSEDRDKVWNYLDRESKGRVTFAEFCVLGDLKSGRIEDPFETR